MVDTAEAPGAADVRTAVATRRWLAGLGQRSRTAPARAWVALEKRWGRLALTVAGGALLCLSFPPFDHWWTAPLAFALLGAVLTAPATRPGGAFGYGLLFGLAFYLPLLPWTGVLVGPAPWLALATMCAVFPGVFGAAAWAARRLPGWPLWFAVLWAGVEWLKCSVPFGGFPWGVVAFGQAEGPLVSIARLGGVPVLSMAVALIGFAAVALAAEVARHGRRPDTLSPPAVVFPAACLCAVLAATAVAWPSLRQSGADADEAPVITVAAVQGNVPRMGLDFNAQRRAVLDNHVAETERLADDVRAGRLPPPDLVIWPENASDIDPLRNADAAARITGAAEAVGAPILVGTVMTRPESTSERPAASNTVLVWDPAAGPVDRHDKRIIQPFGEYLPWRGFFRLFSSYADRAGYFVPGTGDGTVTAAGVDIGVLTCWEVIFDRAARQAVTAGAQLLAVPSNNATFDEMMSRQQLAFARVRAVEHDRSTVVAGTTGISAVIAADGRVVGETGFFTPAHLDAQVPLRTTLTPATRFGPLLQWLIVVSAVAIVVAGMLHNGAFARAAGAARRVRGARAAAPEQPVTDDDRRGAP